jgi:hypothetical protein
MNLIHDSNHDLPCDSNQIGSGILTTLPTECTSVLRLEMLLSLSRGGLLHACAAARQRRQTMKESGRARGRRRLRGGIGEGARLICGRPICGQLG